MANFVVTPGSKGQPFVGVQRRVSPPAPAAGVDWSFILPGGSWWRLLAGRAVLTTSAVVAARAVRLRLSDGAAVFHEVVSSATVPASSVAAFNMSPGFLGTQSPNAPITLNLSPPDIKFPAGYGLTIATFNLDVGDQWSNIELLFEEEDLGPYGNGYGLVPLADAPVNNGGDQ